MLSFRKLLKGLPGRAFREHVTTTTALVSVQEAGMYYRGRSSYAEVRRDIDPGVAAVLGIAPNRDPTPVELDRLFEGRHAQTGVPWVGAGRREVVAYDFTFSAPKSLSVAALLASTDGAREALLLAHQRSVDDAMRHLAGIIGHARRGKGGRGGVQTAEVGWIAFEHHTARPTLSMPVGAEDIGEDAEIQVPGDPQIHTHVATFTPAVTEDGHVGTFDSAALHDRVHEIGLFYQARLAVHLRELGVDLGPPHAKTGGLQLACVPDHVIEAFSRRTADGTADAKRFAQEQGLDWDQLSPEAKVDFLKAGALRTRVGKGDDLSDRDSWLARAADLGWAPSPILGQVEHPPVSRDDRLQRAARLAAAAVGRALEHDAVLKESDLRTHAARALVQTGCEAAEEIATVADLVRDGEIPFHKQPTRLIACKNGTVLVFVARAQIDIELELSQAASAAALDRSQALSPAAVTSTIAQSGLRFDGEHGMAQLSAIHALGEGSRLSVLIGVAGAGKTTLMKPLVQAWRGEGRRVLGVATAWRQANALLDTGADEAFATAALLAAYRKGKVVIDETTVLVVDEVGQVAPRQALELLKIQRATGCTIKMLGDPEQAQAVEAGSTIGLLRDVLPPGDMPELLSTVRQATERGRRIASLFREGRAGDALALKRDDGDARLMRGGYEEVVDQAAALFLERRAACPGSVTASAPTNHDAAAIGVAIRGRLQASGEIGADQVSMPAQNADGSRVYDLPIALGDRVRLYKQTPASIEGSKQGGVIGSNGSVVSVVGITQEGLDLVNEAGTRGRVKWSTLQDKDSGRLLLGPGWCLTIDSAQGITSAEHLNFLPRGSSGVGGAFKAYVAESRHVRRSITLVAEDAERAAIEQRRALGPNQAPITEDDIWDSIGASLSQKRRKMSALSALDAAERARVEASRDLCLAEHRLQAAGLDGSDPAPAIRRHQADDVAAAAVTAITDLVAQSAADPAQALSDLPDRARDAFAISLAAAVKRRQAQPAHPQASPGIVHVRDLAHALEAGAAAALEADPAAVSNTIHVQQAARAIASLVPALQRATAPSIQLDLGYLPGAFADTIRPALRLSAVARAPLPSASASVTALRHQAAAVHGVADQQFQMLADAHDPCAGIRAARDRALVSSLPLQRLKLSHAARPEIPDITAGFGDTLQGALRATARRIWQRTAIKKLRRASDDLAQLLDAPGTGPWQLSVGKALWAVGQAYERVRRYSDAEAAVRARDMFIVPLQHRAAALPIAGQARSLEAEFCRIVPGLQPVPTSLTSDVQASQQSRTSQRHVARGRDRSAKD